MSSLAAMYASETQRQGGTRARAYVVRQACQRAMRELRELEDFARLDLDDALLAARVREVHECLTERVSNGRRGVGLSRAQMEQVVERFEAGLPR